MKDVTYLNGNMPVSSDEVVNLRQENIPNSVFARWIPSCEVDDGNLPVGGSNSVARDYVQEVRYIAVEPHGAARFCQICTWLNNRDEQSSSLLHAQFDCVDH